MALQYVQEQGIGPLERHTLITCRFTGFLKRTTQRLLKPSEEQKQEMADIFVVIAGVRIYLLKSVTFETVTFKRIHRKS